MHFVVDLMEIEPARGTAVAAPARVACTTKDATMGACVGYKSARHYTDEQITQLQLAKIT
jgi:hypothetical protein